MKTLTISVLFIIPIMLFAQVDIDPALIDQGVFDPQLQEVSLSLFEDPGFWKVHIPIDDGIIVHKALQGSPALKEALELSDNIANEAQIDEKVLGVRTDFFRRTITVLNIIPAKPILVPGVVHTFSIWVAGRNTQHELKLLVRDRFGNVSILSFGKLNFLGWKKLEVGVPPNVQESSFLVTNVDFNLGLEIIGLALESDLLETYGRLYVYFDDLRAVTDVSLFERDPDDMVDGW